MSDQPDQQGSAEPESDDPTLDGAGPAWPPVPEPVPPAPNWLNGRAITAVWRDTLAFAAGGVAAAGQLFPQMRPGRWVYSPEANSEADVYQAIAAKLHLGTRILPILADAQLVVVDPRSASVIPDWSDEDELVAYASGAHLPMSPVFLDFEDDTGLCVRWHPNGWSLPFDLRGALCWTHDDILSIVPFGSVDGEHIWGGTDYQAWARWLFLQTTTSDWPQPGPGDSIAAEGDVMAWVDLFGGSICAYQSRVAFELSRRILRLLWAFEQLEVRLEAPALPRPERRRAKRADQGIGALVLFPGVG